METTDPMERYEFTFKKQIEIQVKVEITINRDERDPSNYGINVSEEDFTIEDTDQWEEALEEDAEETSKELLDQHLYELIESWEKSMENKTIKIESSTLGFKEMFYVNKRSVEDNEGWKRI